MSNVANVMEAADVVEAAVEDHAPRHHVLPLPMTLALALKTLRQLAAAHFVACHPFEVEV